MSAVDLFQSLGENPIKLDEPRLRWQLDGTSDLTAAAKAKKRQTEPVFADRATSNEAWPTNTFRHK